MPLPGGRSFNEMVEHVKRTQNVDDESARKIVGSIEHKIKRGKLQLKLMQLNAGRFDPKKPNEYGDTEEQARARELITAVQKNRKLQPFMNSPEGRKANRLYVDYGIKINPKEHLKKEQMKGAQLKKNNHLVSWYDTPLTKYASMKLVEENGKFAKYWLLNAKDVNGNGWGVTQSSVPRNIMSFINRPFVITAKSWIPDSAYGSVYDHPHIPTNDMNAILKHQEHYRVANIIDVHERDGEWFAILERNPKYAHLTLPPFCSPAIYQLDALEHESALSKWMGLHLAGLDENPAYGARIAIFRGSCDGPRGQCVHQLKEAKQYNAIRANKSEMEEIKAGVGVIFKKENKSPLERDLMDKFWNDDNTAARQLGVLGRTNDDKKTDLLEEDTTSGYHDFERDQTDIDMSKRINPEHPHTPYDIIKKIRSGKIKLMKMKLAIMEPGTTFQSEKKVKKIKQLYPDRRKVAISQREKLEQSQLDKHHFDKQADDFKNEKIRKRIELDYPQFIDENATARRVSRRFSESRFELLSNPKSQFKRLAKMKLKLNLLKIAIRTTFPKIADVKINPEHGRTIADAYDQMKHDPENPEVKAAYGALIKETSQQYEDLIKGGLKIDKVTDESNAYRNSAEMHRDVLEKNHLNYFPTEGGFGPEGKNKDHPMLQQTKFKDPEGKPMLANDMFRIVHDINGHVRGEPSGFGPRGEQQAYLTHKQMFSSKANKALFTETAGQNNWVNFNKKSGESNRKNPRNTQYAEQKAGLLSPNIIYGKWHI